VYGQRDDEDARHDSDGHDSDSDSGELQDIETQIYDGLSGTIIVGDDRTLLSPALRNVTARTLVLKDMQITNSSHIVAITSRSSPSTASPRPISASRTSSPSLMK
jgi:hypothetical protein